MYDLIGDIHGHAGPLKRLLQKLGYQETDGVWQHTGRQVIFVGDYIDRGLHIRETLRIVKRMTEAGHAIALMGNHEYNALAYAHQRPDGTYLREHNDKHNKQHRDTLDAFKDYPGEWKEYLAWFKTLPLFLDTGKIRAVHATWDDAHIQWLKANGTVTMTEELLVASHEKGSQAYVVINDILKGKEVLLPAECSFEDKDGHIRNEARARWWMSSENKSYGDVLFDCPDSLQGLLFDGMKVVEYPSIALPVFFGHYWLKGDRPKVQAPNVICLDYSVARKGQLVGYRWNERDKISEDHFEFTGASELAA